MTEETFGCYAHDMKEYDEDSIFFRLLDSKYSPAKRIFHCFMCKSTMRYLK